jgi:hypothetical protein
MNFLESFPLLHFFTREHRDKMSTTTDQLLEVFGFLSDPQAPVRRIALASLL